MEPDIILKIAGAYARVGTPGPTWSSDTLPGKPVPAAVPDDCQQA